MKSKRASVTTTRESDSLAKLRFVCEAADQEKALDIRVLDVHELTLIADYFVVCTGTSSVHIRAITEGVQEQLRENGHRARPEGNAESNWTVLDYGDIILHIFSDDLREFYDLESLWSDAVATSWSPEALG